VPERRKGGAVFCEGEGTKGGGEKRAEVLKSGSSFQELAGDLLG